KYGNVTQIEGPNGGGCQLLAYDGDVYRQLPSSSVVYTGGCTNHQGVGLQLKTLWSYDRGLDVVTSTTIPSGAQSTVSRDAFGRISQIYEADPENGVTSSDASLKADYTTMRGGPTQVIHVQARDSNTKYRNSWIYLDGLGAPILELHEAGPHA